MKHFNDFLSASIPAVICISIISFYLISIYLYRIQNEQIEGGIGDELGQYTMAIKGIWQKSICPKLYSYNNIQGYYCYPLAFAWLCGQAGRNSLVQKIFRNFPNENTLLPDLDQQKAVELKSSILILKLFSGLIFPIVIQLIILLSCLVIGNFSVLSLIIGIAASLITDSVFTTQKYAISTRNVGYFLYLLFGVSLLKFAIINSTGDIASGNKILLFSSLFFVSLFIHQCSQRSSQTFIVLLASASLFLYEIRLELLSIYFVAQFLLLQLPFSNYSEFIRSHFYNRIHDSEWSTRLYGHFRYGFSKILSGNALKKFKDDMFKLDYLGKHMTGFPYYKSNWFALFGVHRIYIYMLIILIGGDASNHILLPIKIVLVSTLVPSILCFFRPFQGYGSLEVYVWSNIPLAFIACLPFLINSIYSGSHALVTLVSILEAIYIVFKGFYYKTNKFFKYSKSINKIYSIKSSNFLDATASSFTASIHMNNIIKYIRLLSIGKSSVTATKNEISIMALEMHPQSFIEVLTTYINGLTNSKIRIKNAFVQLDNIHYGYFQDYVQFFVSPNKIANVIKPDILLVDSSRPASTNILRGFLKFQNCDVIYKSGPLILLKMTNKIKLPIR